MGIEIIYNSSKCPGVTPGMEDQPGNTLIREVNKDGATVNCVFIKGEKCSLMSPSKDNKCIQLDPATSDSATYKMPEQTSCL